MVDGPFDAVRSEAKSCKRLIHFDWLEDLLQFISRPTAPTRQSARRYDTLSPAVLNLIAASRRRKNVSGRDCPTISICGEIAGRPLEAMALDGIGPQLPPIYAGVHDWAAQDDDP